MTFGQAISKERKDLGLTQKELASKIVKEDGNPISPQYLNDIEHDRRNPPGEHTLKQLARLLEMDLDYLYFLAGEIPTSLRRISSNPKEISEAMRVFRSAFKGNK